MKFTRMTPLAIVLAGSFVCATGLAKPPEPRPKHSDVEFVFETRKNGERKGEISHTRNTGDLALSPLVHTFTNQDGSSSVVTISYVGYANFQVAENRKKTDSESPGPGHVFAFQIFTGKKGVTIDTAETNITKLIVYQESPQSMYEDGEIAVTIRNQKP